MGSLPTPFPPARSIFSGGTVTIGGGMTDTSAVNGASRLTVGGGTLDVQGHEIGAVSPIDTLNFQSGTLKNVGQINNGAPLTKTTGGTTISAGTLQIGNRAASGSVVGNVTNNGTLAFNRSDNVSFTGVVSGGGALVKLAGNTLTLTANDTYTGGTTVSAATLEVKKMQASNAVTIAAGAALRVLPSAPAGVDPQSGDNAFVS